MPTEEIEKITFKKLIMTVGNLPSSYVESLSYYECMLWLCNYLENTVVPAVNNNGEAVEELQGLYVQLKNYVDTYFDDLDVQTEINNKLDEMALNGTLTTLIGEYVQPYINAQNIEIAEFKDSVNTSIQAINNKVESATDGSPLPASSTADMTDTSKIYVLISTGEWYYYNGTAWTVGGEYQKEVANYDTTLTVSDGVADSKSIGDRINQTIYKTNYLDVTDYEDNKKYASDGTITSDNSYVIFNSIIPLKNGDELYLREVDNDTIKPVSLGNLIEVNAYGNFIRIINNSTILKYKATADCFVKINWVRTAGYNYNKLFAYINTINKDYKNNDYKNKNTDEIKEISEVINSNSIQYNYLDKDSCILNQNLDSTGAVVYSSNGFLISNKIPVKTGDVVKFYNFNSSGTYNMIQICKFDTDSHFIERTNVTGNTFTADYNGYFMANITKPTSADTIDNLDISINNNLVTHHAYGKLFPQDGDKKVKIEKVSSTNYKITFGDYNLSLIKFINSTANANAWNLLTIKKGDDTIVPGGTDIIGPVRINNNSDFIGGVHGDETTNHIILNVDSTIYKDEDIEDIDTVTCKKLIIVLNSDIYDQDVGDLAFDRNVIITITDNKIHISNSYKAKKSLTLKVACIGGLMACQNPIINDITMNSDYFNAPPTTTPNNASSLNTYAIFNTTYGSIIVNNIKGHENPNYKGWLFTYSDESPIRNKVYFNVYHNGSYPLDVNTVISGEFEYIFS